MPAFKTTMLTDQEVQLMHRYVSLVTESGLNQIAPAPGPGRRIVLVYAVIENLEQTQTTITLCEGVITNPIFIFATEQWTVFEFFSTLGREVRLAENTALLLNLSAAVDHNVNVYYFIEKI